MSKAFSLRVQGLMKRYGRRTILDEMDLSIETGNCILLTGENGAGKSTLLRILAGLEKPDKGQFRLQDSVNSPWKHNRRELQRRVMYLHQQPYMFDGSVEYNLGYALPRNLPSPQREQQIRQALQWIDLEALRNVPARCLSGGERQRIALGRAWLANPQLMLLDEPTANLDREARQRTLELLCFLREQGVAMVVASHDPAHFRAVADRHLHIHQGKVQNLALDDPLSLQSARIIPIRQGVA